MGFTVSPLISIKRIGLQQAFIDLENLVTRRIIDTKKLEEQNNKIFIDTYGLQSELSPEVPEAQITLARADREKDCQRLISMP
jgi:hypothetical protein